MRSFVALMTCIGCIALIHSFDKRIVGVKTQEVTPVKTLQPPLPVAVFPVTIPVQEMKTEKAQVVPAAVYTKKVSTISKRKIAKIQKDSLHENLAFIRYHNLLQEIENSGMIDSNTP